jgi:hypothetical protein
MWNETKGRKHCSSVIPLSELRQRALYAMRLDPYSQGRWSMCGVARLSMLFLLLLYPWGGGGANKAIRVFPCRHVGSDGKGRQKGRKEECVGIRVRSSIPSSMVRLLWMCCGRFGIGRETKKGN